MHTHAIRCAVSHTIRHIMGAGVVSHDTIRYYTHTHTHSVCSCAAYALRVQVVDIYRGGIVRASMQEVMMLRASMRASMHRYALPCAGGLRPTIGYASPCRGRLVRVTMQRVLFDEERLYAQHHAGDNSPAYARVRVAH